MRALRGIAPGGLIVLTVLFSCSPVSAGRHYRRADTTEPALKPWVTVDADGKGSTVTPVLTTINGVATTLSAAPASLTATGAVGGNTPATTTSGGATPTKAPGGAFEVCYNLDGEFAPFCKPDNGTVVLVDESYYVTWDSRYFNSNDSVYVQANYVNATGGGRQAFQSALTPSSWGFISWKVQAEWFKGLPSNNVTLFITAREGGSVRSSRGPTLMIASRPPPDVYRQPKTEAPSGQSLYIALPAVAGFIILCVCGTFLFNRKKRQIGLGNIMGRKRGYGVGKSRRQRLGLGKKSGGIQLREQELVADGQYRDVPVKQEARVQEHRRMDSDGLESLVGTPTEERPRGGNVFRDEIRRQDQQRL